MTANQTKLTWTEKDSQNLAEYYRTRVLTPEQEAAIAAGVRQEREDIAAWRSEHPSFCNDE